jgi:DnaJ-class molecular chaperone
MKRASALRAPGKSMPRIHGPGEGNLYGLVDVKTPAVLTPRQCELFRKFKIEASKKIGRGIVKRVGSRVSGSRITGYSRRYSRTQRSHRL